MNEPITIQILYPNLSADELQRAEENFRRYLELICEIERRYPEAIDAS